MCVGIKFMILAIDAINVDVRGPSNKIFHRLQPKRLYIR